MNRIPTVDVIVVSWNHERFIESLFDGFARVEYPREALNVYIVDNASTDGTADAIRARMDQDEDMPNIFFLPQEKNLGFAGGNNLIMRESQADYVYLLNPDAAFEKDTLTEIVRVAEEHKDAGAFQSAQVLMQDPSKIGSVGNDIVFTGHGYCRGYKDPVSSAPKDVREIAYASGASVLYRTEALRDVGYFDETLFAYHEDLDLGWRMWIAGIKSLLVPTSIVRHHFEFSRSIKKWYWMERNRIIVLKTLYRIPTLILLLPALLVTELVTWITAIFGGWGMEKVKAMTWFLKPSSWAYIRKKRKDTAKARKSKDRDILKIFVATIEHQETDSAFMRFVANPLMKFYYEVLKRVVVW